MKALFSSPVFPVPPVVSLLFLGLLGAGQDVTLEPDPTLQDAIRAAIHAPTEVEQRTALDRLRELGGKDYQDLVPQLLYYSGQATSTRDGMAMGVLVDVLRIPDGSILRTLVPLLETSDPKLRKDLAGVLSQFEHATADRPPSFEAYRPFLDAPVRAGQEPPPGLVRYLYERDAGAALLFLVRVHRPDREELREILWAEHAISDTLWMQRFGFLPRDRVEPLAREQFDLLSRHPRWWARLYAAQLMRDNTAFRDDETIQRLANDRHALVKQTAAPLLPSKGTSR